MITSSTALAMDTIKASLADLEADEVYGAIYFVYVYKQTPAAFVSLMITDDYFDSLVTGSPRCSAHERRPCHRHSMNRPRPPRCPYL